MFLGDMKPKFNFVDNVMEDSKSRPLCRGVRNGLTTKYFVWSVIILHILIETCKTTIEEFTRGFTTSTAAVSALLIPKKSPT